MMAAPLPGAWPLGVMVTAVVVAGVAGVAAAREPDGPQEAAS
jgi:hypothetical protein